MIPRLFQAVLPLHKKIDSYDTINIAAFFVYFLLLKTNNEIENTLLEILLFMMGSLIIFFSGLNFVLILQSFLKKSFEKLELLSLSLISIILVDPLLLVIEQNLFKTINNFLPLANCLFIFFIILFFKIDTENIKSFLGEIAKKFKRSAFLLKDQFFLFLLFNIFLIFFFVLSYETLPDLDPYGWLNDLETYFNHGIFPDLNSRPFFSALAYFFTTLLQTSLFDFFKYILPFFSLSILVPAWMVAKTLPDSSGRFLLMLMIFSNPSTILYLITPMPQLIFIIIFFYFIYFNIYSFARENKLFYYAAGTIIFLSFFYHPMASIALLPWIITTLVFERKRLLSNKFAIFFLAYLILFNPYILKDLLLFVFSWIKIISFKLITFDTNFMFPANYENIDEIQMGWPGFFGVTKFYLYYAGPMIIFAITLFACFLLFSKKFRKNVFDLSRKQELIVLFSIFLIFFCISEILPRFPNIALLPDRAWTFAAISTIPLVFVLLKYLRNKLSQKTLCVVLILFLAGIGGATYINYLKKYLITPKQLKSAEWIKANLPENRIVFSHGNKNLLRYHSQSYFISIPQENICYEEKNNQKKIISYSQIDDLNVKQMDEIFYDYAKMIKSEIELARFKYEKEPITREKLNIAIKTLEENKKISGTLNNFVVKNQSSQQAPLANEKGLKNMTLATSQAPNIKTVLGGNFYIYYSKTDTNNPYNLRGYNISSWGSSKQCPNGFAADKNSSLFKRIYTDNDEVIIWKVLDKSIITNEIKQQ